MKFYLNNVPLRILAPFLIRCNKYQLDSEQLVMSLMHAIASMTEDDFKRLYCSSFMGGDDK